MIDKAAILRDFESGWEISRDIVDQIKKTYSISEYTLMAVIGRTKAYAEYNKKYVGRKKEFWTDEKKRLLVEMYNAGVPFSKIATRIGRRGDALSMQIRRMKDAGYNISDKPASERRRIYLEKQKASDVED